MRQIVTKAEARAAGSKTYFTGMACKNGHVAERRTVSGVCSKCLRSATAAWTRANKGIINANRRDRYATDERYRQRVLEISREVRNRNESTRKASYRWWLRNKNQAAETRKKYVAKNRERILVARREYYQKSRETLLSLNRANRAKRAKAPGKHTKSDIAALLESQGYICANRRCGVSVRDTYHVDHIVPLSRGGTNWPDNLQILCPSCNLRKNNKDPLEWAKEQGIAA